VHFLLDDAPGVHHLRPVTKEAQMPYPTYSFSQEGAAAYRAAWEARKALAASLGIPFNLKRAGRWLALRSVDGDTAVYGARPKQMRTAWRRHQPVEHRVAIAEARAQVPA
jgi:hypothetical protein